MLNLVHYCDCCGFQLEEEDKEVPIYVLKLPTNEMYFFCSEDCMEDFLKDLTFEGYVYPNGSVDMDD